MQRVFCNSVQIKKNSFVIMKTMLWIAVFSFINPELKKYKWNNKCIRAIYYFACT